MSATPKIRSADDEIDITSLLRAVWTNKKWVAIFVVLFEFMALVYLANTMLTLGVGLISGIVWFLPLALIAAYATQKLAIEREERHLDLRFGKRFRDYVRRVRRWI